LGGDTIALAGYWSNNIIPHSCVPQARPPKALEPDCHYGEYGITDLPESILARDATGEFVFAVGAYLTPWFPEGLAGVDRLFSLPIINDQRFPPVPIILVGHFDDLRSQDCPANVRGLCEDRFVVEQIASFDPSSVPTPGPYGDADAIPLTSPARPV
jgi:hypothetical protein